MPLLALKPQQATVPSKYNYYSVIVLTSLGILVKIYSVYYMYKAWYLSGRKIILIVY